MNSNAQVRVQVKFLFRINFIQMLNKTTRYEYVYDCLKQCQQLVIEIHQCKIDYFIQLPDGF